MKLNAGTRKLAEQIAGPVLLPDFPLSEIWKHVEVSDGASRFEFDPDSGDWSIILDKATAKVLGKYASTSLLKGKTGVPIYVLALSTLVHEYAHAAWFTRIPPKLRSRLRARPDIVGLSEIPALWAQAELIAVATNMTRSEAFVKLAMEAGISDTAVEEDESFVYGTAFALAASFGPAATLADVLADVVDDTIEAVCGTAGSA